MPDLLPPLPSSGAEAEVSEIVEEEKEPRASEVSEASEVLGADDGDEGNEEDVPELDAWSGKRPSALFREDSTQNFIAHAISVHGRDELEERPSDESREASISYHVEDLLQSSQGVEFMEDSTQLPTPRSLRGKLILVENRGLGFVTGFRKVVLSVLYDSQHTVDFSVSGGRQETLVLRRRKQGQFIGERFALIDKPRNVMDELENKLHRVTAERGLLVSELARARESCVNLQAMAEKAATLEAQLFSQSPTKGGAMQAQGLPPSVRDSGAAEPELVTSVEPGVQQLQWALGQLEGLTQLASEPEASPEASPEAFSVSEKEKFCPPSPKLLGESMRRTAQYRQAALERQVSDLRAELDMEAQEKLEMQQTEEALRLRIADLETELGDTAADRESLELRVEELEGQQRAQSTETSASMERLQEQLRQEQLKVVSLSLQLVADAPESPEDEGDENYHMGEANPDNTPPRTPSKDGRPEDKPLRPTVVKAAMKANDETVVALNDETDESDTDTHSDVESEGMPWDRSSLSSTPNGSPRARSPRTTLLTPKRRATLEAQGITPMRRNSAATGGQKKK